MSTKHKANHCGSVKQLRAAGVAPIPRAVRLLFGPLGHGRRRLRCRGAGRMDPRRGQELQGWGQLEPWVPQGRGRKQERCLGLDLQEEIRVLIPATCHLSKADPQHRRDLGPGTAVGVAVTSKIVLGTKLPFYTR